MRIPGYLKYIAPIGAALPMPVAAQAAGPWHVVGTINGKAFIVDCHFDQRGPQIGGACVDAAKNDGHAASGKSHLITQGSLVGDDLRWSYPVKVLMMSIDINFAGKLTGNTITGTISAKGRQGTFSATRVEVPTRNG